MVLNGEKHQTVSDAATYFGVKTKTVREWIKKGIISEPPSVTHGVRTVATFPDDYLRKAQTERNDYLKNKNKK
ncbi:hypothetical protein JCM12296A_57870 [Desulfosarcina cetonica]